MKLLSWAGRKRAGREQPHSDAALAGPLLDEGLLRRLERLTLAPRRPVAGGLGGEHRSSARASSLDFADHRPYTPGDDFRRVDWNAYGRLGHLYVKLTEAREQLPVHILLDASQSMAWGDPPKLRYACRLAAALGYVALARFDRLAVTILGETPRVFPQTGGRGRFGSLLAFLGQVEPAGRLGFNEVLAGYRVDRRTGGQAIVISDLLAPDGYQDGLDALSRAGLDVVVLQVLSPGELEPVVGGDAELVDAETGEIVEVTLSTRNVARYRERLERWCDDVGSFCRQRGARYVRISTGEPLEDVLLSGLRQAAILR
ncbi:MAG: DUF58 domain-containing protein [Chloroflexi bacterium]|nr:DUF58 domain-containing protein [Chloroflexota bacterium]